MPGPAHLRRPLVAALAAIATLAGAAPVAHGQVAISPASTETGRLWSFVDRRAEEIEPLWRPSRGMYASASGRYSTRLQANMLEVHAYAAIAGRTGAARHDERIAPLVRALTSFPAFVESSDTLPDNQFHLPGWFSDPVAFPSDQHVAIDSQVAEALQVAWTARHIVDLPDDAERGIRRSIGLVAWSPFFRYPGLRLNQFNWYADLYTADSVVNGKRYLLRHDYRQQLVRFLEHATRPWPHGTTNLNAGLGLHYLPQYGPDAGANRVSTSEYDELIFHGLENYVAARAAGMTPLQGAPLRTLEDWARRALYGEWTHAGFLNWDSGLAFARWQLTRYWSFALSGLGSLASAPILNAHERAWARWMFDRALGFYDTYQAGEPTPSMPSALFGVRNTEAMVEDDPLFIASRTAMTVAQRAVQGFEESRTERPPALYAYDFDIRRLAVTTPRYSTTVLDQTFDGRYGGVDLARLFDALGRPLGSIGSAGGYGFGLRLLPRAEGGLSLLDTEPGRRVGQNFRGPEVKRAAFLGPVRAGATVLGHAGSRVAVQHAFTPDAITTTYRVQGPRGARADVRLPVWARYDAPRRPEVTVHEHGITVHVHQSAGGYDAVVRAAGTPRTSWRVLQRRSNTSPGTAATLDVLVPLRAGRATIVVTLHPRPVD